MPLQHPLLTLSGDIITTRPRILLVSLPLLQSPALCVMLINTPFPSLPINSVYLYALYVPATALFNVIPFTPSSS